MQQQKSGEVSGKNQLHAHILAVFSSERIVEIGADPI